MTAYYIDNLLGHDGNAGTSEGQGNAFATLRKAGDVASGGDTIWVKNTGTDYVLKYTITRSGTVYTAATRHLVKAAPDNVSVGDIVFATITGGNPNYGYRVQSVDGDGLGFVLESPVTGSDTNPVTWYSGVGIQKDQTVTVNATGDILKNTFVKIKGYKTTQISI